MRRYGGLPDIDLRLARASVGIVRLDTRDYASAVEALVYTTTDVYDSVFGYRPSKGNWLAWIESVERERPEWFDATDRNRQVYLCELALQFEATTLLPNDDGLRTARAPVATRVAMTLELAETAVRLCLIENPTSNIRDVTERVGCSTGLVAKTLAWKAVQARHREHRGRRPSAASLDNGLHCDVGQFDPALLRLIGE